MSVKKNAACTINVRQIEKSRELALGAPQKDIAKYEKVILAYGNVVPVTVAASGDMYQLVDGHARIEACVRSGIKDIPVVVTDVGGGAEQAKLSLLLSSSREQGGSLSEGALIEKLVNEHKQTLGELSRFTGRSKSWLSKRQVMARNLALPVKDMVINGSICTRTAEEVAKISPDEQVTFAVNIVKEGLSKDDVCRLVNLYRSADATIELCNSIVESPANALLACPKVVKSRRTHKDKQSIESRIRGACFYAMNILEEITRMIITSDDISLMAADSYLLKLKREMQILGRLIIAHVNSDVAPGKREGGESDD